MHIKKEKIENIASLMILFRVFSGERFTFDYVSVFYIWSNKYFLQRMADPIVSFHFNQLYLFFQCIIYFILDPTCILKPNGNYRVDSQCRTYYQCFNSFRTERTCPSGEYFDQTNQICISTVPNDCQREYTAHVFI